MYIKQLKFVNIILCCPPMCRNKIRDLDDVPSLAFDMVLRKSWPVRQVINSSTSCLNHISTNEI